MNKGCMFCMRGEPLNDTSNSNFTIAIERDGDEIYLGVDFDDSYFSDYGGAYINYCPMCGRKFEVAE